MAEASGTSDKPGIITVKGGGSIIAATKAVKDAAPIIKGLSGK